MSLRYVLLLAIAGACNGQVPVTEIHDFRKYYDQFNVDGCFMLYDQNNNRNIIYNPSQIQQPFIPASTFKICNSLIGLETGVISDENFIIPWDSIKRQNINWNKDHNLKTAFENSAVWYYQELARRVGGQRMKYWLDKVNYGNTDTSGGIDKFWLSGGLRITPEQQIDFVKRLHEDKLPFSQRNIDIVKKIMVADSNRDYILSAKSGWSSQDNKDIGWYVGYVEAGNNVYYFANCIQTTDINNNNFAKARIDIVYRVLDDLKVTGAEHLKITHLTKDFYIYTTSRDYMGEPYPANGMYLVTSDGVVMFDSPWDTTQFQPLLDSIRLKHQKEVIMCIATHSHEDRTGGLEYYKHAGIKTYTTKHTDEICRKQNKHRAAFLIPDDTLFTVGQYSFQTYFPGQGHTPDNIVVWFNADKILYGGCLVKSTEAVDLGYLGDANTNEWPATLRNIKKKFGEMNYVIPGHQDWPVKSLDHTLELLQLHRKTKGR